MSDSDILGKKLEEAIQEALNEHQLDLGPQLLGDWVLVAEVHTAGSAALRYVSNANSWRVLGMLAGAKEQTKLDYLEGTGFSEGE